MMVLLFLYLGLLAYFIGFLPAPRWVATASAFNVPVCVFFQGFSQILVAEGLFETLSRFSFWKVVHPLVEVLHKF